MSYLFESLQLPIHAEDRGLTVYWEDEDTVDALLLETVEAAAEFVADSTEMEDCYA